MEIYYSLQLRDILALTIKHEFESSVLFTSETS